MIKAFRPMNPIDCKGPIEDVFENIIIKQNKMLIRQRKISCFQIFMPLSVRKPNKKANITDKI